MSKALSVDLRERVVAAVATGASRRAAAARFGVSVSSAIRWCILAQQTGSVAPGPLGGDRRSGRIEAHGPLIRGLLAQRSDITLQEIRAALAKEGVQAGLVTIWRFFQRHRLTRKKTRAAKLAVVLFARDWRGMRPDLGGSGFAGS
jgi:transposase